MERHITYQDDPVEVFQEVVELHIEAINRALVNIPRNRVRLHVCWGNAEGPTTTMSRYGTSCLSFTGRRWGRW